MRRNGEKKNCETEYETPITRRNGEQEDRLAKGQVRQTEYETPKTRRNREKENCETIEKNIEAGHLVEDKKLLEEEREKKENRLWKIFVKKLISISSPSINSFLFSTFISKQ